MVSSIHFRWMWTGHRSMGASRERRQRHLWGIFDGPEAKNWTQHSMGLTARSATRCSHREPKFHLWSGRHHLLKENTGPVTRQNHKSFAMLILTSQMLLKSWRGNRRNGIVRVMGMSAKEGVIRLQLFGCKMQPFLVQPFCVAISMVYRLGCIGCKLK